MQKSLPMERVPNRKAVIEMAVKKAGGHRELERSINVARTTWTRFLSGETENLRGATFEKIRLYLYGK